MQHHKRPVGSKMLILAMNELIILPGWGQDSQHWQNQLTLLKDLSPKVLDLPGFGSEKLISKDWGIPEYAKWVKEKLESEKNYILLGHSFGGRIAAYLAAKENLPIKALVLYASPLFKEVGSDSSVGFFRKLIKSLPYSIRSLFYSADLKQAEEWGMGEIFRKAVVFDQSNWLANVKQPTLILWGENDNEVSITQAHEVAKLIPNSVLKTFPGVGHNLHLENPYLFYSAINDFVKNLA